jgi:outer membrane receptor for ferrienterochelin and colicin
MKRTVNVILALAFAVTLLRAPNVHADDLADEADLQFNLGADRYEAHDYNGALEHFLASNRLVPNKNVIFNIARSYEQLRKAPEAYRYYVLAAEGEKDAGAKKRVEDALTRIAPSVAVLKIETDPPGANVYLDRRDLGARGTTPRALGLAPGKHIIIVELPGYEPVQTTEKVEAVLGQEKRVEFKLVRLVGSLRIEGDAGAQVRVDDENATPSCTTPCTFDAPIGKHTLFVTRPGYGTGEYPVEIASKQSSSLRVRLTAETGSLVVNADVRDAQIEIDGEQVGFTPAVLPVQVGEHKLRVSRSGFRTIEQSITIKRKDQTKLDLTLASQEEVSAASRITESVEDAPASVSIVSRDELRAMGYPTVAEAVRGVRGMYLSDDRSYTSVGFRGFSRPGNYGNRVLILLDGQPMNDNYIWSSFAGYDGRVDLEDVERIEIVRGPGSVLYGTSAFLGVINLVTKGRNAPSTVEGTVSTADYGVGRARAHVYKRFDKETGFWNTISGAFGAGRDFYFSEYDNNPADADAAAARGRAYDGNARGADGLRAGMINGRVWHKAFTAQWFLNSRGKTLPTGEYGTLFGDTRTTFRDTRGVIEARFEPQVSKELQSLSRTHLNFYDFAGNYAYADPAGSDRELYRSTWAGLEQRFVYTPNDTFRLTVGGEFISHFQVRLKAFNNLTTNIGTTEDPKLNKPFSSAAAYVSADATVSPTVKLSGGARFDYFTNLDKFEALPALNPRVAAIFKPYAGGNIKVLFGKAFKTPAVYELYYQSSTQKTSNSLVPEQIYSGELEYSHRFSPTVTALAAGYFNYISKVIELGKTEADAAGVAKDVYTNSPADLLILGAEAELKREWREGWMASVSYTFQRARYWNADAHNLRRLPNSPEHLASFKGAVPIIGRSLTAMTRVSIEGPRPDGLSRNRNESGATNEPQGYTETGVIWDLVFSGESEKLGVRYNVGLYNAADWKYDSVPSREFRQRTIVQNGRTVLASVTATF